MTFKILLGPAGIPAACNGSSVDAVKFIRDENLSCMEIQFVRGVHMKNSTAKEVGEAAKKYDISLSVHAPYYINLASSKNKVIKESVQRILDSLERAHHMNARIVVVHPGYYGEFGDKAFDMILQNCQEISDKVSDNKWKPLIGLETTAKEKQFGTLDEILKISSKVKHCVPVIDFGHLFAKQGGKIDYKEIFDKLHGYKNIHSHFSNMKKNKSGGYSDIHMVMDHSPPFEPLAEEIMKRKINITIISESPITDVDSLKMKKIFEKLGYKF